MSVERWPYFDNLPIHEQIVVPRCCDDIEVMDFLAAHFIEFRHDNVRSMLTSGQVFDAAKKRFGLLRCESVHYWEH